MNLALDPHSFLLLHACLPAYLSRPSHSAWHEGVSSFICVCVCEWVYWAVTFQTTLWSIALWFYTSYHWVFFQLDWRSGAAESAKHTLTLSLSIKPPWLIWNNRGLDNVTKFQMMATCLTSVSQNWSEYVSLLPRHCFWSRRFNHLRYRG